MGPLFAILTLIGYNVGKAQIGIEGGQTLAFLVLALSQVIHSFNMRSEKSLFKTGLFGNKTLNLAALVSLVLVAIVLFLPINTFFGLVILPVPLYLLGVVLALVPVAVMEVYKIFSKQR